MHDSGHNRDSSTSDSSAIANSAADDSLHLLGLRIFLLSLTVLFLASMAAYTFIRFTGKNAPPAGSLLIPRAFWISTLFMLATSGFLHRTLSLVRRDRLASARTTIIAALAAVLGFLAVQVPSMYELLHVHQEARSSNLYLYGLMVMLIALHALHVLGGLIPLSVVIRKVLADRYHSTSHGGLHRCALYWHFLDVVWLAMLAMLLLTR